MIAVLECISMRRFKPLYFLILFVSIQTFGQDQSIDKVALDHKPAIPATFEGGMESFYQYVGQNIRYPKVAYQKGIGGRIYVEFVIDSSGSVLPESITILKGAHKALEKEAIRIVENSPKWLPAKETAVGPPVASKMVIPIVFQVRR